MRTFAFSISVLSAVVLSACAHSGSTPDTMAEDTSPLVTPAEVPWKDMTGEQKGRYMARVVMPKMKETFQAYDPKEFSKFTCGTCHGKNPKEKGFKMPSPDLPALPASEHEFMATVMKEQPQMVKFMGEKVTPQMAQLLGVEPFNHADPKPNAFSCNACHTLKGQPDSK
jgi:mono/diheme cytochrome c family protein